jgi:hypothetical protein
MSSERDPRVAPRDAADLGSMSDDEVRAFYRQLAFDARHPFDRMVELELIGRFTVALKGFKESSDKASARLLAATWALVALTVVIVFLTVALVVHG